MKGLPDRLKEARIAAGFDEATAAATAFGWAAPTYLSHENGSRTPRYTTVEQYARAFRVSTAWLLTGYGKMKGRLVPLVGYVGAGAEVFFVDDHAQGAGLEYIEAPSELAGTAVAVQVRGNSMYPAYKDGDIIFYDEHADDLTALIGRECVVRLRTGETFVKLLSHSSHAGWTLLSHNAPPLVDISIEWAAPVAWVKKA